jgi:hypothetical protein
MKNWGKFFILVLMILAMTACGEKGGGSSGTVVNPDNPYSWDELYEMIGVGKPVGSNYAYSLQDNLINLGIMKKSSLINSALEEEVDNLISILSDINYQIVSKSSSFKYTTSLDSLNEQDERLTGLLKVKTSDELETFKTELDYVYTLNLGDLKLKTIRINLEALLATLVERKAINHFYAKSYDLFYYYNYIMPASDREYLKTNYGIDLEQIDHQKDVKIALAVLQAEIIKLDSNEQMYESKPTLSRYLDNIVTSYKDYISGEGTYAKVVQMREDLRLNEASEFGDGSSTLFLYKKYIDDVYSGLDSWSADGKGEDLVSIHNSILSYLNTNYITRLTQYDAESYGIITSKSVLVLDILQYLKGRQGEIQTLGIAPGWLN